MASRSEGPKNWRADPAPSSATGGHVPPDVGTGPLFEPLDSPSPAERRKPVETDGAAALNAPRTSPRPAERASSGRVTSDSRVASRPERTDVIPRGAPVTDYPDTRRRYRAAPRRVKRTLRHVDPMSVLKLSFIYYACFLVVWLIGVAVLYWLLESAGLFRSIENFQDGFVLEQNFDISLAFVEKWALMIGFTLVVLGSLLNTLLAFLYNVASDVAGGVEMTFVDREV